ncbi:MAG: tripartite tricarboxylate transporter permease [Lautropia sp.]
MLANLSAALSMMADPAVLVAMIVGTIVGIVVGVLPGLGSVVGITMVLPFTIAMAQLPSVALMLGVYCGSVYGGSITAVLINTPGTPASAATCFDGYPMARRGEADLAIGWVTLASLFGGVFSILILVLAAPQLAAIAVRFGPVEYFALMVFAMTCIATVSQDSLLKGLLMGMAGLFIGVVGADPVTGDLRFEFGVFALSGGIGLIPVVVGAFALAEVFHRAGATDPAPAPSAARLGYRVAPWAQWWLRRRVLLKASMIGAFIGVLPGTGAATASFISYSEVRRTSPRRDRMGHGEPDGLIASEAANNAVTGGALVPTLALGIPGDPVTAVMLGSLVLQGVTPGPKLFAENASVVYAIFFCLLVVNLLMAGLGLLGARWYGRILRVPEPLLLTAVSILALVGAYGVNNSMFDVLIALVSGIVMLLLRSAGFAAAPMVIGLVLGPLLEEKLRQGLIVSDGNFLAFFASPIASVLFLLTLAFLAKAILPTRRNVPIDPEANP